MNRKWKKITFVLLDVIVLGFFGFYLALNLKYKDSNELNVSDFAMKVLVLDDTSNETITCGANAYASDGKCVCNSGYSPNSDGKSCYCPSVTVSISATGGVYSSPGEVTASGGASNGVSALSVSFSGGTLSTEECSASGFGSVDSSTHCTKFTANSSSISGTSCTRTATVTYKATNTCGNSASAQASITVMKGWSSGSTVTVYNQDNINYVRQSAEDDTKNVAYEKCDSDTAPAKCTKYSRGCGTARPEPACYKDSDGFLWWDYDFKDSKKSYQQYNSSTGQYDAKSGWTRLDGVTKEQCYTQFKCSTTYPGKDEKEAACNSTSEFDGSYLKKCGVKNGDKIGDEFYRIDCNETMKTGFNGPILNDASHPNSFMYPGTAFKFNYIAKTKVECEGKWHQDFYNKAENYVKNYIDKRSYQAFHQEDSGFFGTALAGIQSVRDGYKNWTLNYFNSSMSKETGIIKDQQPTVKGTTKDERQFTLEMNDGSKVAVSSCGSEPNGKNENFTYKVAYTIKMQMPVVYYSNTQKPEYTTTATSGYTSIGRVFPISDIKDYANRKDYKYNVTVSNLGLGHKWVNKETCVIGVKEKEIVFRSINLNDPFIQALDSNHEIGENWKNSKYDFTGIIDPNTWSNPSQFNTVTITQEIGKLIKNELARQYSSYLGSCAKGTDQGKTPQLCALYKQTVAGK